MSIDILVYMAGYQVPFNAVWLDVYIIIKLLSNGFVKDRNYW